MKTSPPSARAARFALAAATALMRHTKLSAKQIAEEAMKIAGQDCIYTNDNINYEELADGDLSAQPGRR
jgi:ATP-dependent protease HslVU (ClpYQ) peptidase subunit